MLHIRSLVLVAAVWALAAVMAVAQEQPANVFVQGVELLGKGSYQEAEQLLRQAVAENPDNEPAWYYLGVARFRLGNDAEALEAFNRARALAPGRPGPALYIGQIYERRGAYAEALRAYQRDLALRRERDTAEVYCALARVYYLMGDFNSAQEAATKALRQEPKMVEAMYWLGKALTELGRFNEAQDAFETARDTLLDWQIAKARLQRKPVTEAEQARLIADEPRITQEYHWAEYFATTLSMWPDLNKATGDMYLRWRRWMEARIAYRRALKKEEGGNPDDPDVYVRLAHAYLLDAREEFDKGGRTYTCIGILKEGLRSLDKAKSLNENYPPVYCFLGEIYACEARTFVSNPEAKIEAHTFEDAIQQFEKAISLQPDYVDALVGAGAAYIDLGYQKGAGSPEAADAFSRAIQYLEKAVTIAPTRADVHAELARAYLAADRLEAAVAEAENALRLDPKNLIALNTAGSVYYYRGEMAIALDYFSRAAEINPNDAQTHVNLGNTYFQMNSWHQAREEYQRALDLIPTAKIANTAFQRAKLYFAIGLCFDRTLNYDKEIEALSQAIHLDDAYFDAYLQLAAAYAAQKEYRAAAQALRIAVQKASNDADRVRAYLELGRTLEQAGNTHEAVAAYTAAATIDPQNPLVQDALQRVRTHVEARG
ncbi:MAG: tetratricopeptide repeat protein [Armatimonadetes bacterium]|nr:tetratricopeptide repeat protein [Armatimonadota bacterium]